MLIRSLKFSMRPSSFNDVSGKASKMGLRRKQWKYKPKEIIRDLIHSNNDKFRYATLSIASNAVKDFILTLLATPLRPSLPRNKNIPDVTKNLGTD